MTDQTGTLTAISRKGSKYQAHYTHTRVETIQYAHPTYTNAESMVDGKMSVSRTYRKISTKDVVRKETAVYDIGEEEARTLCEQAKRGKYQLSRFNATEWVLYVLE